ncbi:DUF523 and DUF1722 domain-containing protein [Thiotrichales bacterium 19S3-7]|nr:DUF523 and DUF1722 domain-containing protein [Thiotrichales bacterium 19S3-7]MCF6801991.1 DUF523 and DUF1722 domain-containing protein [Thiotrichales bacterium 19S3-11]
MDRKILIAVSSCLLGNNVRFNGANSHKKLITEELSQLFEYHAICPELYAGLGVPREPIFFEKNAQEIILKQHKTDQNLTQTLAQSSNDLIEKLPKVYGFILKKSSPSCGHKSVKVYNKEHRVIHNKADGLFVQVLKQKLPLLPVEDEGRLNDACLKEHFIKRVLLTYQASELLLSCQSTSDLIDFHTKHKMLLRLHHPVNQKALGRLVARIDKDNFNQIVKQYYQLFLSSFIKVAKNGNHYTILQRILREINKLISKNERDNLQRTIKAYHQGVLPLIVPIELIKHYLVRYDIEFLKQQSYLFLYPESMSLMSKI